MIIPILESSSGRRAGSDFAVCYNPEFMREGSAVEDFLEPPYIVLGAQSPEHLSLLRTLYDGTPGPRFETTMPVAEMVKYASNMFHAVKVGFANEMGTLCKQLGVDTETREQDFFLGHKVEYLICLFIPRLCLRRFLPAKRFAGSGLSSQRTRPEPAVARSPDAEQRRTSQSRRGYGVACRQEKSLAARSELQSRYRRLEREPSSAIGQAAPRRGMSGANLGSRCFGRSVSRAPIVSTSRK